VELASALADCRECHVEKDARGKSVLQLFVFPKSGRLSLRNFGSASV